MIALFFVPPDGGIKGDEDLGEPGICPVSPNPFRQSVGGRFLVCEAISVKTRNDAALSFAGCWCQQNKKAPLVRGI